jgi:hypothetical protein
MTNRRDHFDAGHGNERHTAPDHPVFNFDDPSYDTAYGEDMRRNIRFGNDPLIAHREAVVGLGDRNPWDFLSSDPKERAKATAYFSYVDNLRETDPEWFAGTSEGQDITGNSVHESAEAKAHAEWQDYLDD